MTTTITAPKVPVPVGLVKIDGREYEVRQHPEIVRFFFDLLRRVGGTNAMSTDELLAAILAAQVGEMVGQPVAAQPLFADVVQGAGSDVQFADVMQTAGADCFGMEATWQI